MSTIDTNKARTVTRSIPYTVTYEVNGEVKRKRFKSPEPAWTFMKEVAGSICFGFRVLGEV